MFSHPELGSDPPIGLDRESGCDKYHDKIWEEKFILYSFKKLITDYLFIGFFPFIYN